jgi:DNA-binding NarL/FixJ family response regulator
MPVMDGLRATHEIVKILPDVPILLNTLHDSAHIRTEAIKAGVQAVISKSDGVWSLLEAVETALSKPRPASTSRVAPGLPAVSASLLRQEEPPKIKPPS